MAVDHREVSSNDVAARLDAEKIAIEQAMREAAQEAVLRHRQAGQPLVVWQDGKIALIRPDEAAKVH